MGPALLIQGPTRDEAIVLYPSPDDSDAIADLDEAGERHASVSLQGRGGLELHGHLGSATGASTDDCERWPVRVDSGGSAPWAIGFLDRRIVAVPLDSVEMLSARDSMFLVAEASRLASAVTEPTSASFQGLRFTVHDIRRFEAAPGTQALVAHLVRRVNQEASPLEEQTLLIAERDSGATSGPYQLAYAERSHGREESVATPEVLAGIRASTQPTLIVARDSDDGVTYAFVERVGPRRWRVRWTSAVTRCG